MATYGEGDPTDNAQELYDQLQQGDWDLNGLNYGVSFHSKKLSILYSKNYELD
jgi:hypothetical protein